jgi:hypothetical protein
MLVTINKALVLGKVIRERMNDLKQLRSNVSTKRTSLFGERQDVVEPTYDIKELDKQILKLQKMAFELESTIKEQNNITMVEFRYEDSDLFTSIV